MPVVRAVLLLEPYLVLSFGIIRTDDESLKWLLTSADTLEKLARWRFRLLELEFEVVHRAGIKH